MPGERPTPDEALRATIQRAYDAQVAAQIAAAPKVELSEVDQHGYSIKPTTIDETIALHYANLRQQDADLRKRVAHWIIGAFIGANVVTLIALGFLAWLDQGDIASKLIEPGDRIITEKVIMTLLGATTVQVGVG